MKAKYILEYPSSKKESLFDYTQNLDIREEDGVSLFRVYEDDSFEEYAYDRFVPIARRKFIWAKDAGKPWQVQKEITEEDALLLLI